MYKFFVYSLLGLLALSACSDEERLESKYPILSFDIGNEPVVLSAKSADMTFAIFYWTRAELVNSSASPEYVLEMDFAGNNFTNAVSLINTNDLSFMPSNSELNQALIDFGVVAGEAVDVEFRIAFSINGQSYTSDNVLSANITPYEIIVSYAKLYVPGDQNSWGFDDANLLYSVFNDGIYEGYLYLDNGDNWNSFKMSYQPNWDSADAIIGDADASGTSGVLQVGNWGGNNVYATDGKGVYYIQADIPGLTYTIYKTDWAMTGDFNSWGFTDMTYNIDTDKWILTADLSAGGFKFIANQDWSKVKGDNELDGILDKGTDENNIKIEEDGNYTITLDLSQAIYTYSVEKN